MARLVMSLSAAAAILCCEAPLGQAQTYGDAPWCAIIAPTDGEIRWDCRYRSGAECMAGVTSGDRGFCNVNPYWSPAHAAAQSAPKPHGKRRIGQTRQH